MSVVIVLSQFMSEQFAVETFNSSANNLSEVILLLQLIVEEFTIGVFTLIVATEVAQVAVVSTNNVPISIESPTTESQEIVFVTKSRGI